jgi:hypothetical protein
MQSPWALVKSPWARVEITDSVKVGRKIVEWTLDKSARPNTFDDFKNQLAGGLTIVDLNVSKFELVDTPSDTIVIRLPPEDMIKKAKAQFTDPNFQPDQYPFPGYLPIDPQRLTGITAEELFYSAVGSYTTAECE